MWCVTVSGLETENMAVKIRRAENATPSIHKTLPINSKTSGCYSVGIVRPRTIATEFSSFMAFIHRYIWQET
jgi:hypothetical protein